MLDGEQSVAAILADVRRRYGERDEAARIRSQEDAAEVAGIVMGWVQLAIETQAGDVQVRLSPSGRLLELSLSESGRAHMAEQIRALLFGRILQARADGWNAAHLDRIDLERATA